MRIRNDSPDLVILDLMLPEMDGMSVCRQVRAESSVPIIMLTARDDDVDKILGLEFGADDYVTKPFNTRELIARVKAVLRRGLATGRPLQVLRAGQLDISPEERRVRILE